MTIYYLYVKTHKITGLKYLGKTARKDPHKYRGSGKYWSHHIRKHGYDVHTEIIRECQTNEEVRQWGLYYSELWQVVESDNWANLKEEAGDGCTSEQARENALKRVSDGTHHFTGGENVRRRVEDGTHNWLGGENVRRRVEDGTHNWLGGENVRRRIEDGTHNWLGGEIQRRAMKKRVADGTHHLLGGEIQRQAMKKRVADGTHNFLTPWTCPHCDKSGRGTTNFNRWHGDNCRDK